MVCVKVVLFSFGYQIDVVQCVVILCQYCNYVNLVESYSVIFLCFLVVIYGVFVVGKSQVVMCLVEVLGVVCLCLDIECKCLFGEQLEYDRGQFVVGIYSSQVSEVIYVYFYQLVVKIFQVGYLVVIDVVYLKQNQCQVVCYIVEEIGVLFLIFDCQVFEVVIVGWFV